MRITDVRWTPAYIPIEAPLRYAFGSHPGFSRIIVEVITDEGLIGLGECYGGPSREGQLAEMRPQLIGEDPFQLERIRCARIRLPGYSGPGAGQTGVRSSWWKAAQRDSVCRLSFLPLRK